MVTKKDWIAALPRYKRGQGFFRTIDDKFCPLGILADLIVKEGSIAGLAWVKGEEAYTLELPGQFSTQYEWPTVLRMATGVTIESYHLARFNDSANPDDPKSTFHTDPWKDTQEWMNKVSSGKDKTPSIPDFDTKSPVSTSRVSGVLV
jgi:hypothetical protein